MGQEYAFVIIATYADFFEIKLNGTNIDTLSWLNLDKSTNTVKVIKENSVIKTFNCTSIFACAKKYDLEIVASNSNLTNDPTVKQTVKISIKNDIFLRPGQTVRLGMNEVEFSRPVPNATYEIFLLDASKNELSLNTSEYFEYIAQYESLEISTPTTYSGAFNQTHNMVIKAKSGSIEEKLEFKVVTFNNPPNIVSPLPTGLKSSYFVTYNKVKVITYKGLFADVDGDTLTSSVGIVVGSYAKTLPHWIFWDSTQDKLDIYPTDLNVGYYKIRITGKDPYFGEVNYDIELEVYQLPGVST
jgi:hypothetical protein